MAASPDWVLSAGNDLRLIGDTLVRVSRTLHEHSRKLEKVVDGKYASEVDDPRVQLLTDSLYANRMADLELGRLNQALQRVLLMLQQVSSQSSNHSSQGAISEREREALNSSIIDLKQ